LLERGFLDAIIGVRPITMGVGKDGPESIELEHLSHSFDGANDPHHHGRRQRSNSISDDEDVDDPADEDGTQLYSPIEERAVIRKLDRRLVLFVALLYMLSFLDRSSKSW
jgi:hypothetical protein